MLFAFSHPLLRAISVMLLVYLLLLTQGNCKSSIWVYTQLYDKVQQRFLMGHHLNAHAVLLAKRRMCEDYWFLSIRTGYLFFVVELYTCTCKEHLWFWNVCYVLFFPVTVAVSLILEQFLNLLLYSDTEALRYGDLQSQGSCQ